MSIPMKCPKHGCVMTETITDDVFCGVCRTAELIEALKPFAEIGERYERDLPQEGDWMYRGALRAYRNATGQRQVRKYHEQSPGFQREQRARAWVEEFTQSRKPDQFMPYQPNIKDLVEAFLAGNFDGRGETE